MCETAPSPPRERFDRCFTIETESRTASRKLRPFRKMEGANGRQVRPLIYDILHFATEGRNAPVHLCPWRRMRTPKRPRQNQFARFYQTRLADAILYFRLNITSNADSIRLGANARALGREQHNSPPTNRPNTLLTHSSPCQIHLQPLSAKFYNFLRQTLILVICYCQ